jgi:hypothetical protein
MKSVSRENIGNIGMSLKSANDSTWVYLGYRSTSVGTFEHHFARVDYIPQDGPWLYRAVQDITIRAKFPDIVFPVFTIEDDHGLSDAQIEEHVFLLWESNIPLNKICEALSMTERELRSIPAIDEMLNK